MKKPIKIYVVYVIHEQMFDLLSAFTSYKKAKDLVKKLSTNPNKLSGQTYEMSEVMMNQDVE